MVHPSLDSRFVSVQAGDYVLTHGCRYHPELQRWEPVASVRHTGVADPCDAPCTAAEHFQATPEEALALARSWVDAWRDTSARVAA